MRSVDFVCCLAIVAGLAVCEARGSENPLVRTQLTANYAAFSKAFQNRDIHACAQMMMPNYVAATPDGGKANRKQVLADLKQRMTNLSDVTWSRTITKLNGSTDTALATVDGDLKGTMDDKAGRPHAVELVATTLDLWVRSKTGWKLQHSRLLKARLTVDGKSADAH